MAYAAEQDVQDAAGGEQHLRSLTDMDAKKGVVQSDVVTRFVTKADSLIDSYASQLYSVPFAAPVPEIIKTMSAELAVFMMKQSRGMLTPGDGEAQGERIKWLEKLAEGSVDPGVDPRPTKHSSVVDKASSRPSTKDISREELKGFW